MVVSCQLYPWKTTNRYPLDRRPGVPQSDEKPITRTHNTLMPANVNHTSNTATQQTRDGSEVTLGPDVVNYPPRRSRQQITLCTELHET